MLFEAEDFLRDMAGIFGKLEIMIGTNVIRGYGVRVLVDRPYKLTVPTRKISAVRSSRRFAVSIHC